MIILAGIVFTVVIWWLVVAVVGGLLGLLARPVVRRLRGWWRRRHARRAEHTVDSGPALRLRTRLPEPSSDWWPDFERQFRAHVRASSRANDPHEDRRGPDRGR